MKLLVFTCGLLFACAFTACGSASKSGSGGQNPNASSAGSPAQTIDHHSMLIDSASDLPTCDASAEGWLIYIKISKEFRACSSSSWDVVDISQQEESTNDKLNAANLRLVFDAAGADAGYMLDDGSLELILRDGGAKAKLKSLADGFDPLSSQDLLFLNDDCSDAGYLALPDEVHWISSSSISIPNLEKSINIQTNFGGKATPSLIQQNLKAKKIVDKCEPTKDSQAGFDDPIFYKPTVMNFKLPFKLKTLQ